MKSAKWKPRGWNNDGKINFFVLLLIVVAAVAALIYMLGGGFSKTVHSMFDSPKNYFAYVEKKTLLGKKENPLRSAINNTRSIATSSDQALKEQITLTIGEHGENYLSMLRGFGIDLTWLKNASVEYVVNSKDMDLSLDTELTLNDKKILSSDLVFDSDKKAVYVKIPELSKNVAKYSLENYEDEIEDVLERVKDMQKAYPSSQDMDKLFSKYLKLALKGVENVERDRGALLECNGVTQRCTLLRATLKQDDIKRIITSLCAEAAEDKDLKELVESYCLAMKMDADKFDQYYDKLVGSMGSMGDKLEDRDLGFEKITVEIYVDGSGKIVGRIYSLYPVNGEKVSLKMAAAVKGRNVGYEISYRSDEENITFAGTGKLKSGRLTGEYDLKVDGNKILTLSVEKFDLNALNKGFLKGHFTCELVTDVKELDLSGLPRSTAMLLNKYASVISSLKPGIDLVIDVGAKKHVIEVGLLTEGEELLRVSCKGTRKSATAVKIPSKAVDVTETSERKEYLEDLNWDKLLDSLEGADVPTAYLNLIRKWIK